MTPPTEPGLANSAGVFWSKSDCTGYFEQILNKKNPIGCYDLKGSGVGSLIVGGTSSLGGTVFDVKIVKAG